MRPTKLRLPSDSVRVQQQKKADWNEERSVSHADFFTIGYSGRTLEDFIEALRDASVSTVIDVRQNPVSMYKPDFSKGNLKAHLEANGISYSHVRDLGVPRDIRSLASNAEGREPIWKWYDDNIVNTFSLHRFFNFADHPVALLCTELDPTACHRHRLALSLEQNGLRGYDL